LDSGEVLLMSAVWVARVWRVTAWVSDQDLRVVTVGAGF
jgi:hypothetical protein